MGQVSYYLVFKAEPERAPGRVQFNQTAAPQGVEIPERVVNEGEYVPYSPVTVVEADDAQDACAQVASVYGRLGGYFAVEGTPVSMDLKPRRLRLSRGD